MVIAVENLIKKEINKNKTVFLDTKNEHFGGGSVCIAYKLQQCVIYHNVMKKNDY